MLAESDPIKQRGFLRNFPQGKIPIIGQPTSDVADSIYIQTASRPHFPANSLLLSFILLFPANKPRKNNDIVKLVID